MFREIQRQSTSFAYRMSSDHEEWRGARDFDYDDGRPSRIDLAQEQAEDEFIRGASLVDGSRKTPVGSSSSASRSELSAGHGIYSGSGLPLVSGANGSAARPTRKTRHIVTPA